MGNEMEIADGGSNCLSCPLHTDSSVASLSSDSASLLDYADSMVEWAKIGMSVSAKEYGKACTWCTSDIYAS